MAGSDLEPDIADLFCHYNALYFHDSLGACAVSWTEEPLPYGTLSACEYYPGGGGCIVLLSKSLYECHPVSDLKNVLLHEMIHAHMCVKENNTNHSDHGVNFQKLMNTINSSSLPDAHRPVGGYSIIVPHEIRKKYQYKCERCGDLVKSTEIRGPSHDDCIERMGANYSCMNSMCQWHSHKKRCSGSYYAVRESPTGCVRLKGSIASSAKETLGERKVDELTSGSWHAKHTSNKGATRNKHGREDASAEFLHLTPAAIGSSGLGSSCGDRSSKRIKLSKDRGFDLSTATTFQQVPKRPRTDALNKNHKGSRQKKRKVSKWDGSYSVLIEQMNYYFLDHSEEDEVPLINKRTERRKRQKLLQSSQATQSSNGVGGSTSSSLEAQGTITDLKSVPASQIGERLLPNRLESNHVAAAYQTGHGTVHSPLDSPMAGEIVDISDG
ncbi:DNA-dependent metalloprotease dvc-1-like [Lolium rigidum]|uniref:DNA-dependent metalloprotease dvc-1-like n=1 Tax=Lolium rigidum TaxID=89674 RepID=UPI001F5D1F8F|nr:DNA-dependent metalloprotease dvc-1-like [Lolium rigidum]